MSRLRGAQGEASAARFLAARGFCILTRNYHTREGEIDLVALDGGETVFVEVKQRSNETFGSGLEAIGPGKQHRLRAAIEAYRQEFLTEDDPVRVDVVLINPDGSIEHLKGVELEEGSAESESTLSR